MQQINKELDENKDIIKTFSSAETKEVNDRINEKNTES